MKYGLHNLTLETTRRCNLQCAHCMRGPSQNIDISPETIDIFLYTNNIKYISEIIFSGGEPTLNPDIIIYTINKIIKEELNVHKLVMVTNGQFYNQDLVDAFNRFNAYRNKKTKENLETQFSDLDFINDIIEQNTNNHVRITFSTDRFHKDTNPTVKEQYLQNASKLKITEYAVKDENIYKTGFSQIGEEFTYQLEPLRYYKENGTYVVLDSIYITANGNISSEGMGQYSDMDKINMGSVENKSLTDILIEYGKPIFDTPKITKESIVLKKESI